MYPSEKTLEALWTVNQIAKEYANRAAESYEAGAKGFASTASARKRALYDLKSAVLATWVADETITIDSIEGHEIDGREYYCLEINGYSFHTPVSDWGDIETRTKIENPPSPENLDVGDATELSDFDNSSNHSINQDLRESEALSHIAAELGYSPNDFLKKEWNTDGHRPSYNGWGDLPRAKAIGDEVPPEDVDREFLFEVGDSFPTDEHGDVEITDRKGVLETGEFRGQSYPKARPHYDVRILDTGEIQEAVSQKSIFDWDILIGDPADPNIPSHLMDQAIPQEIPFKPGETIHIEGYDGILTLSIDNIVFGEGGLILLMYESHERYDPVDDMDHRLVDPSEVDG